MDSVEFAKKRVAEKIIQRLSLLGWQKQEAADKLNVQPSSITKYISGQHNFTLETLIHIQEVMGVELLNLHIDEQQPEYYPIYFNIY